MTDGDHNSYVSDGDRFIIEVESGEYIVSGGDFVVMPEDVQEEIIHVISN